MSRHEDNERHFKAWLDKNSWRKDLKRLESQYGGYNADIKPGDFFDPKSIWYHCQVCKEEGPKMCGCPKPYTDEFTVPVMDMVKFLKSGLDKWPLGKCEFCHAEIRMCPFAFRSTERCTVCSELAL